MAGHRVKTEIDAAFFATANLVHRGPHVVVNPPSRHAAEDPERVHMRLEQHLMSLQWIGTDDEGPAVAELAMRDLQLGPDAADDSEILTPVELESFAWLKGQWHEGSSTDGPLHLPAFLLPGTGKSGDPIVGAVIAKTDQVTVNLFDRSTLFARSVLLTLQPRR